MDIGGHVSNSMLKHYSHIQMEAKRNALRVSRQTQSCQEVWFRFVKTLKGRLGAPTKPKRRVVLAQSGIAQHCE
jgi:hypothetical protein